MMNLSPTDVKTLTREHSPEARSLLARKIASDYRAGNFTVAEAEIAHDIFRMLLKDVEGQIRLALAEQLSHCDETPRDIILKLAGDETDVASYVLEYSHVLTEDDLMEIIASTKEVGKMRSIARRDDLSEKLCGRLIDTHAEMVLSDLFANTHAPLTSEHIVQSWDYIASKPSLLETLVHRGGLPLTIAEKIFFAVSDELKRHLANQYKFSKPAMHKALSDVREWQMLGIIPPQNGLDPNDDEQVEELIDELHVSGRLTYSLLMRALCAGNMHVFETGIAKLAGLPRINARILLMDSGPLGFDAIYKAADMPEGFMEAVRTLLQISFEETQYGSFRLEDFRKRIIERIYVGKYHQTIENMEYMLSIIGGKMMAPENVH